MPRRTKATLRELRNTEALLAFHKERDQTLTKGMEHMRAVLASNAAPAAVVEQLQQAMREAETALNVAERMHQLRMQELSGATFRDES